MRLTASTNEGSLSGTPLWISIQVAWTHPASSVMKKVQSLMDFVGITDILPSMELPPSSTLAQIS